VNRVTSSRKVQDTIFVLHMNSNLHHATANNGHRSPIARFQALLDAAELISDVLPRRVRERADLIETAAVPYYPREGRLHALII